VGLQLQGGAAASQQTGLDFVRFRPEVPFMTTQLRISGKNLGQLALPNFCPRCFWLKMRTVDKLPWQIFPGIFSSIDSYTKKLTDLHFQQHRRIPMWFDEFGNLGEPIAVPHHSVFRIVDGQTDILLTGVPDEMFRGPGGWLFISDNKTARFTGHQDELLPMYYVQLNAYAVIANRVGLGPVSGLGLIYHEPRTNIDGEDIDSVCNADGFSMRFVAKLFPVELHPQMIPPLLARVREICDLATAPMGRDGCEDCVRLGKLMDIAG
jgi:hypothetical protein